MISDTSTDLEQHALDKAIPARPDGVSAAGAFAAQAHPNEWLEDGRETVFTVLGMALLAGSMSDVATMLKSLAKDGIVPMHQRSNKEEVTFFDHLAVQSLVLGCSSHEEDALKLLQKIGVPREWSLEMGRALLRATEKVPVNVDLGRTPNVARALALAAFDDKQDWFTLLKRAKPAQALIEELFWQTEAREEFSKIIRRAIDDGASVDEIPSALSITGDGVYTASTLLQTAVIYQKPDLVKFFIEMGADPCVSFADSEKLPEKLRGASLLSAAQTAGAELGQIIATAIAKYRVDQVLAQSRQHNKAGTP